MPLVLFRAAEDIVKVHMLNRTLRLSLQVGFVYAEEADVLNVALFGMTAKE